MKKSMERKCYLAAMIGAACGVIVVDRVMIFGQSVPAHYIGPMLVAIWLSYEALHFALFRAPRE